MARMTRTAFAFALLGSLALLPAAALAMEPYLPRNPKAFTKADADGNGKVTAAEITPLAEKRFTRMDADGNGAVTAAEIDETLRKALERRRNRILAALDADKDGSITKSELDRFVEQMVANARQIASAATERAAIAERDMARLEKRSKNHKAAFTRLRAKVDRMEAEQGGGHG